MAPVERTALSDLEQSLGEAIELAKQARYADLTAHAEALERDALALAGSHSELARPGPQLDVARKTCERIRRKIFVLAELFRHASAAQAGLAGLHQAITTPYAASGRLPLSRNPFAVSGQVDSEA